MGHRFENISVSEQVQLFTQTFQSLISNYIPHETITCDDGNPPRIDEKIKNLFLIKTVPLICKKKFQSLQAHLKTSIGESKQNYESRLSNKLLDSKTSLKSYWSILKTFLNNKKMPYIPNLLHKSEVVLVNIKDLSE